MSQQDDLARLENIHTDGVRVRLLVNCRNGAAGDVVVLSRTVARDLIANAERQKDGSHYNPPRFGPPLATLAE